MNTSRFQLPAPVLMRANTHGHVGSNWIQQLDSFVAALEAKWGFQAEEVLSGGSESLVVTARFADEDQREAILKVGLPGSADLATEAHVYRLAAGRGYANVIAHDAKYNAMLLERLGKPLASYNLPVRKQIKILCETLHDAWQPLLEPNGLMTGAEKAHWLAAYISDLWPQFETAGTVHTRDEAIAYAHERAAAFDPTRCVLVHGDAHAYNTLAADNTHKQPAPNRYKLIDPDGLFAEPAVDLAVLMRGWSADLLAGDALALGQARCQLLADLTGVEPDAIWQWGFIERVSTGLTLLNIGMEEQGREMLMVADIFSKEWRGIGRNRE